MARNPRSVSGPNERNEHITTLSDGPLEQLPEHHGQTTEAARTVNPAEVKGDATENNPDVPADAVRKTRYFRVENAGMVLDKAGYRTRMNPGKEVDDLNYDIRRLQQQGIKLTEITDEQRTTAPLSQY